MNSLTVVDNGTSAELVSVIVPCYNKAEYVRETLESVLDQRGVEFEVLVIDDVSTDGSWSIISEYADRVRAIRLPANSGSTYTRNYGAELAVGNFLMFLDADDVLAPDTLHGLVAALRGTSGSVAACRWRKLHREGTEWVPRPSGKSLSPPGGDYVHGWLAGWYFPPCAILWPREVYDRTGGWDEMGPWDDADIMMRALLQGTQIIVADEGEAFYRILEEGNSLRSLPTEAAVRSRIRVLDKVGRQAEERNLLPAYRDPLGRAYYALARRFATAYPELVLECFGKADRHLGRTPVHGSRAHRILWKVLGLERKERITMWLASRGLLKRSQPAGATVRW